MFGRVLSIDLSVGKTSVVNLDEVMVKSYIGGKGTGAYLLYTCLKGGEDPLGPDNPLIFITGPFTGTSFPTAGRMVVIGKSPLTGIYVDSHTGGYFGPEMRKAGFDGLILRGKCPGYQYIWIEDGQVEFRDAKDIWGLRVEETIAEIRQRTFDKAQVACIGPAGERMVKISSIMFNSDKDKKRAGVAARAGLGAVMGSKNLKAVALKGSRTIELYDEKGFKEVSKRAHKIIFGNSFIPRRKKWGTPYWVKPMNDLGILPTHNFQTGFMKDGKELFAPYICKQDKKEVTCYSCPIRCGKVLSISNEKEVKVEYESLALLGSNNGINRLKDVAQAIYLCNSFGLDTISTGNIIGFAMECKERGILEETPGFGDAEGQQELIIKIAEQEGIGKVLGQGVREAAREFGENTSRFALQVKGLEIPGYEPRSSWGMALAYATSDRGACHQRAWTVQAEISGAFDRFSFKNKAHFVKELQNERAIAYSLIICDFAPLGITEFINGLQYAIGLSLNEQEYLRIGDRIWNLIRLFNIREGISAKDDTLPARFFEDELPLPVDEGGRGSVCLPEEGFKQALAEYYQIRGWDSNGIPTRERLEELGLLQPYIESHSMI